MASGRRRERAQRSEPRERRAPAKRRARERAGESAGRSPSEKKEVFEDLRRRLGESEATDYTKAGGLAFSYQGLARYWNKRHAL